MGEGGGGAGRKRRREREREPDVEAALKRQRRSFLAAREMRMVFLEALPSTAGRRTSSHCRRQQLQHPWMLWLQHLP